MPLRVVTGRANAGKTGRILGWALDARGSGQSPTLIVPNLADVRRLQMELAGKAPLGVRVSTADSFAEEIWQLHGDGRRFVEDATRSAVMRQLLAEANLGEPGTSARTPGFERLMLRAAKSSPLDHRCAEPAESEASTLVIELLLRYREALTRLGLIEHAWLGALLREDVPETGLLGALRFTSFSAAQTELLVTLSVRNTVCVALTWEQDFAPTAAHDAVAARLLARADVVEALAEPPATSELERLADALGTEADLVRPTGHVMLGEARGREGEAALVAHLARGVIDRGTPPERVAIVFPHLARRLGLVRNALTAEGLEGDFDCPVMVGVTPFGRALAALVRVALGRGARADALEFLQGPFSDTEPDVVLNLDRGWRKNREGDDSRKVLASLIALKGSTAEAAKLCRDMTRQPVDGHGAQKWQKLADHLISSAALSGAVLTREDVGAHRAVCGAVAQMASAPGSPFGVVDILDTLPTLLCAASGEESPGRVQVIQASRVGARRFDAIIVGGLTKDETPGASGDTFASEISARVAGRARADEAATASLEFYSLISRARNLLALVRQTQSSDGVIQLASPMLEDVLDAYRDSGEVADPGSPPSGLEVVRANDVLAFAPVFTRGRRAERTCAENLIPHARNVAHGTLDAELAAASVRDRVFSATEVETYLQCPYSWFYSRILRPDEVDAVLDAAELGSRAHGLIAAFYAALKAEGADRVVTETLPAAIELFERTADAWEKGMAPPMSLGEEIDLGRARLWARHVVEDDAHVLPDHVPFGHEIDFGREKRFEFAGVPMAGRIDRIDASAAGLVVADYKSARDVGKLVRPGAGGGIQHVVYAAAAEDMLGQPVQAAVYRSLRIRQMRGYWRTGLFGSLPEEACAKDAVDEAQYAEIVELAQEQVTTAVDGMRAGRIPRTPRSQAECRFCALGSICEGART